MPATAAPHFQRYTPPMAPMFASGRMAPASAPSQQSSRIVELDDEDQFKQIEEASKTKEGEERIVTDENEAKAFEETLSKEEQFENIWELIKTQILDHTDEWVRQNHPDNAWDRDFNEYTTSRPVSVIMSLRKTILTWQTQIHMPLEWSSWIVDLS
jgi:uncharacterized protein YaaR (DUF327 family)